MRVCVTAGGELIADQYAKPLPWIGLYIATASLLCAAAMAFDAYCGFRRLKLWFPCRLFSLHATTLTVLAVATKMPLDVNTSMPRAIDQLTKLSGMVLLCTAMGNLMPSLGAMNESEILPNVVALTIMVVTALANIWIQIGTGVIYAFLPEHAVVMVLMMVLLLIFVSTALPVPITKDLQEKLYDCKYWPISFDPAGSDALARLQMSVKKYWLITHTCRQYVPGWSATCTASGAFCLLAAAVFVEALLRGLVWESRLRLCRGTSDYGWSSSVVLSAQAAGILLGTVAPACRWFNAVRFWSTDGRGWSWKAEFRVEDYWVKRLKDWKAAPLQFQTGGGKGERRWRRIAHRLKDAVMSSLIWVQKGVVTGSKLLRLVSVLPLSLVDRGGLLMNSSSLQQENVELKEYVLYFEGEEDLVRLITRSARKDAENWIEKGRRRAPATMLELIKKHSSFKDGFKEVGRIDNKRIRSQVPVEPPSCWALPLVTLAGVAVALPGIDQESVESLLCGVGEGLRYVRLIEKNLDQMGLVNMRKAADLIWHDVEFYDRWLGQDLHSVVPGEERNGRKVIEKLQEIAEERLQDFLAENHHDPETNDKGDPLEWPEKVLAAHCMDRVCRTILLDYDCKHQADDQRLFSRLQRVIADILGACLTNLSVAVFMECFCNKGEVREKSVKEAAHILGEAEEVLTLLGRPEVARLFPEERRYIHDWRKEGESGCSNLPSTLNMAYFTSPSYV